MNNPWKWATIGILAVALTALASSVMTAYVMRPTSAETQPSGNEPAPARPDSRSHSSLMPQRERAALVVPRPVSAPARARVIGAGPASPAAQVDDESEATAQTSPMPIVAEPSQTAPVAAPPASIAAPVAPSASNSTPVVATPSTASAAPSVAADCETGGDRAWRIAKPGALGGLLGAALGAASGAIADGGKSAGTGALIGAGVGAVAGGGYGAYQTQQECGTIFGSH